MGKISIIWCVWVEWAVPPRTCGHGGSVGALHTPKLCASDLNNRPRRRAETIECREKQRTRKLEAVGASKPEIISLAGEK